MRILSFQHLLESAPIGVRSTKSQFEFFPRKNNLILYKHGVQFLCVYALGALMAGVLSEWVCAHTCALDTVREYTSVQWAASLHCHMYVRSLWRTLWTWLSRAESVLECMYRCVCVCVCVRLQPQPAL